MKIAIFTDSFFPQVNGVVTSIIDLAMGMTDKGHKVFIISHVESEAFEEFTYKDIEVLRLPAIDASFYEGFKWSAIMHKPTFRKLRKENIDIVHFMTPITVSIFGILVGKLLRKPMIGTYHTFVSELTYIRQFFPRAGSGTQKLTWYYTNAFYNRADLITTPTDNAKKELLNNGCRIKIEAVSNGIKLDCFNNSKSGEIKDRYNPNGEIILYVGRVAPEKNMECLLEAFKGLCQTDTTTKMVVVGGGPSLDKSKKYIEDNGLSDRVIFLGLVPNTELKQSGIFGACRMFVTASTTETQSITILEAQANGIPAIGPNAKGIPNVIEHNVNGFLVEPDNCDQITDYMKVLLEDDELHSNFSKKSIESASLQDINKIIDGWEDRYHRVIMGYTKRPRRVKTYI